MTALKTEPVSVKNRGLEAWRRKKMEFIRWEEESWRGVIWQIGREVELVWSWWMILSSRSLQDYKELTRLVKVWDPRGRACVHSAVKGRPGRKVLIGGGNDGSILAWRKQKLLRIMEVRCVQLELSSLYNLLLLSGRRGEKSTDLDTTWGNPRLLQEQ